MTPDPRAPRTPPTSLPALAAALRGLPPSCGPVRLIAVDGHAGSGKSTFARRLAEALGGAPVLRLDDIASHDQLFDWTERLRRQVLDPLSRGETARYAAYDWHERCFGPAEHPLPPAPVVLVEGVGAGRRALRGHLAAVLWMDVPRERVAAGAAQGRGGPAGLLGRLGTRGAAALHRGPVPALRRPPGTTVPRGIRGAAGTQWGADRNPSRHPR